MFGDYVDLSELNSTQTVYKDGWYVSATKVKPNIKNVPHTPPLLLNDFM